MEIIKTKNLLNLDKTVAKELLLEYDYAFQALPHIEEFILEFLDDDHYRYAFCSEVESEYVKFENKDDILVSKSADIHPTATIDGPAIIGHNTTIRPNAWIRGNVIVGEDAVVGNATEVKNSILFDKVQVPHFNYVGDSILGYKAHFGAGCITSNLKSTPGNIKLKINNEIIDTELRKFGAIVGDEVEMGCNVVLNPGTILGPRSIIYPCASVIGFIEPDTILKLRQEQVKVLKRK